MNRKVVPIGADRSADSYLPQHGNGGYRVRHYDLDLEYRITANRLTGRATIAALATQPLAGFSLDLAGLRVQRVLVDGVAARYTHQRGKLRIRPAVPLADGAEFTVEVRYHGNPRPVGSRWGDIGWDELTDGVLVASQPIGAPSWFPCNDHPADKATYHVSMTTASAYAVLVTGNLRSRRSGAGTTTWVYHRPQPTSTYLMSVQIGRYDQVVLAAGAVPQVAEVPAPLRAPAEFDFARQGQIMVALQRFFGPYPFENYVIVVTADELDDPVEAQGMSIFGANHVDGHRTHERLVVHELAHQWFGNSLTVADWRHIWLNEGFATYAEWLWSETTGSLSAHEHAVGWHARLATRPADIKVADPGVARIFDERVYRRGALTLHALRRRIGDDRFFELLRAWTDAHRHGVVTTDEFTALAARIAGEPLDDLFTAWLWRTRLPNLN
ncbi:MAG TPA: M1 family metallopeptidase [Pseudonocardiaceae bacterium]|nr:M1 family metallopeptidase [Pseudonocardiaceae bacterium]